MSVLVDSSVWIAYFRGHAEANPLDLLLDQNRVAVNELILAEIIPPLEARRQHKLITLLRHVKCLPLVIDWEGIIRMQVACLRRGAQHVGIPDLIIAQQAVQCQLSLYSLDKHFRLIGRRLSITLY